MNLDIRPQPAPCGAFVHGLDLRQRTGRPTRWPRSAAPGCNTRCWHSPIRTCRSTTWNASPPPSAPSAWTRTSAAWLAIRTSRRSGATPTKRPRSSPRPGIRTGASCRCRRKPPCSTATSSRPSAVTRSSPISTPRGTRCRRHLQTLLRDKQGIHSARRGYARDGMYGEKDKGRSMAIRFDDSALATQPQPIARVHPETGRTALYVSPGYTIGIEGMSEAEATPLAEGPVRAPGARGVCLPPPLGTGHAADVGQPLCRACRDRRLPGPRAAAASHHPGRARGGLNAIRGVVPRHRRPPAAQCGRPDALQRRCRQTTEHSLEGQADAEQARIAAQRAVKLQPHRQAADGQAGRQATGRECRRCCRGRCCG